MRLPSRPVLAGLATAVLLAAAVAGCSDIFSPENVRGSYSLKEVSGTSVPATVDGLSYGDGALELREDGSFTMTVQIGGAAQVTHGTWALGSRPRILFAATDGPAFAGTFSQVANAEDRVNYTSQTRIISISPPEQLEVGTGTLTFTQGLR
jgi:hypothetical protein